MPPKKGKKKGKKGKKGAGLGNDPDEYKSFNVAQRQILQQLFEKMRKNQDENSQARHNLKERLSNLRSIKSNNEDAREWYERGESKKLTSIQVLENATKKQQDNNLENLTHQQQVEQQTLKKYKKDLDSLAQEITTLDTYLTNNKHHADKKMRMEQEIADLEVQHTKEKKEGMIKINEKEFDKISDVKKLTEEMDFKVKETQANLMALNDEQLQTQTRLTILQNHQLTTELDYQSKNTETLVQTHDKMIKQIEVLKRNISLHKQIEKQLAKRAYKSQKIIAGLKGQVETLERQKNVMVRSQAPKGKVKGALGASAPADLEGEELIDFLETKLEGIEKKLAQSQGSYEQMQNNCLEIQDKLGRQKEKYKRAALMLTEFLEDLLSQKPNILKEQARFTASQEDDKDAASIEKIQNTQMEDLDRDDKIRVIFILLKQLQPFLSAQNLAVNTQFVPQGARSVGHPVRGSIGTTGSSIEGLTMGGGYRSTGVKQPLSNNFVNRSLQGGMPTQADSISMGHPAYNQTIPTVAMQGGETIQSTGPQMMGQDGGAEQNAVSLSNLLTNIKVQRPSQQ